jgi:glucose-1-phosphate cytidylyltransferase
MKVVILCGGLGTRLREETEFRPKPMVPVGNRPILWHIMKIYAQHGHKDFILCLGYKGEIIKDYFRNYHWNTSDVTLRLGGKSRVTHHTHHDEEDWRVTLLDTGQETQTGGRLRRALPYIDSETFLATYGDGLTDSNINDSIAFHQRHGRLATITAVRQAGRFGNLTLDHTRITSFKEKPEAQEDLISGGFFVFNKGIGKYLASDATSLEAEALVGLVSDGQVHAFRHSGFWQCMDTFREQQMLERMYASGHAPWQIWQRPAVRNNGNGHGQDNGVVTSPRPIRAHRRAQGIAQAVKRAAGPGINSTRRFRETRRHEL